MLFSTREEHCHNPHLTTAPASEARLKRTATCSRSEPKQCQQAPPSARRYQPATPNGGELTATNAIYCANPGLKSNHPTT